MDAVNKLNYISKTDKSQNIIKATNQVIAVICPNITNPYSSTIVQAVEQIAKQNGIDVIIFNTYRDPKIEKRIIETFYNLNLAGIIFSMMTSNP